MTNEYMSISNAEQISGLSRSTIYRALRKNQIVAFKRGARTLIDRKSFAEFVRARPWAPVTGRGGQPNCESLSA